MGLDVGKLLDSLKLSYGQLRNLLITSLGAVATVWVVGNKVGTITTKIDNFDKTLKEIKLELTLTRDETNRGLDKIYNDFNAINNANNDLWNNKFDLLLEYGSDDKEMLRKMLKYVEKQNNNVIEKIIYSKDYSIENEINNPDKDYNTDKKKETIKFNNEVMVVPVDKYGNPTGDTIYSSKEKQNNIKLKR